MEINYAYNKAGVEKIIEHLEQCNVHFMPPLATIVNIQMYALKLNTNAARFEAWDHNQLVGLVAVYMNDEGKEKAFITNVSVLSEYGGKGIATRLIEQSMHSAKELGFKKMELEVSSKNVQAVALYEKLKFVIDVQAESNMRMLKYL